MIWLKQSTQIKVRVGPFVDATDGVTPETGITLGAADQAEALKADGAATADISSNTWAAVTGADGWYDLTLSTTDTNTVGELVIVVQDSSVCLPVFQRFYVVEEAVYAAMYAASAAGPLQSTTAGRTLDVSAGGEAGVDWANVGSPTTTVGLTGTTIATTQKVDVETIKTNAVVNGGTITFPTDSTLASTTNITGGTITTVGTLTGHTAQTGDSYALVNGASGVAAIKTDTAAILTDTGTTGVPIVTGGIASTAFAASAIDAAAIAANAIGASELAADAVDEILDETIGDSTLTMRQALRLFVAALAGKLSGAATTTVTIRNAADSQDVITATVDANGNRSAVILNP